MSEEPTVPEAGADAVQTASDDVVRTPDETEPRSDTPAGFDGPYNNPESDDVDIDDEFLEHDTVAQPASAEAPDGTTFTVGDIVRIAESFPSYRGEEGNLTALRQDPVGGNFWVADVELTKQKQVVDGSPIWFNNVPLSQLVKVG